MSSATAYPIHAALEVQAENLARFAAISQQAASGLALIVGPDVGLSEDRSPCVDQKIFSRRIAYDVLLEG
jgi:fructose-bisphosphate aldolase, class I